MDADHFDRLSKRLAAPATRRATLGGAIAGGVLSALGLQRAVAAAQADTGGTCVLAFVATVRLGPSASQPLTASGTIPGELRGELSFALAKTGNLEDAVLDLPDGTSLPVVGQATGHALQMRIDLGQRLALVAIGVGEQEIAACQGAVDGLASGPDVGDLGDWHAAALRKADGAGPGAGETQTGGKKGGKKDNAPAGGAGAGAAEGGRTGRGGRKEQPPASEQTGSAPANGTTGPAGGTGATGPAGPTGPSGPTATTGATGASGPSGATAGQAACAPGMTYCGNACVDLQSDMEHCGACGSVCESQLVPVECRQGICERANCEVGVTYCGAVDGCHDLSSDPLHCGACQHPCAAGETCYKGVCTPNGGPCPQGWSYCGDTCVDLNNDDENCGACGTVCDQVPNNPGVYTYCEGGVCVAPQCPEGTTDCANYCADLMTSLVHCGACGVACAEGQTCQGGVCIGCAAGTTDCGGICVDLLNDALNCGVCGLECAYGEACGGGQCGSLCPAGQSYCNGVCLDTFSDQNNCGGCGLVCNGICCAGACVDITSDVNNCGGCGIACTATQLCQSGQCVEASGCGVACAPGLIPCGCDCFDLSSDAGNCGGCGISCPLGGICQGGVCVA